jgi:8-oxo-dGTP pyrophosphatase MutT (NUDIX family)
VKTIYKIGAAIIENGKLLIVKEAGWEKYGVPGGKPEPGESDYDCLKRELMEELAVSINGIFNYIGTFQDRAMNEPETIQIKLYRIGIENKPKKTNDVEDMRWFGPKDDWDILGPIDKNHIMPALIKRGLIG